eukprot:4131541-Pleurochrysis_carterae.AAC.1
MVFAVAIASRSIALASTLQALACHGRGHRHHHPVDEHRRRALALKPWALACHRRRHRRRHR